MEEPIEMKAGDERVLANGFPFAFDYRIVSEKNYIKLKRAFDLANFSNQRELLLAFAEYWNGCSNSLIEETNIDDFLKSK